MTDTATVPDVATGHKPGAETKAHSDEEILAAIAPAAWLGKSLVVADRDLIDKRIRRRNLSASTSKSVSSCAARFAIESMLPRVVNPLGPAELGSGAHEILEHFYQRDAEKRTLKALRSHVRPVTIEQLKPFEGTPQYEEIFAEVHKTIGAWAEMIFEVENPSQVNVFATEMEFKGIKLSNGVPFVGYLDRISIDGDPDDLDNAKLLIEDYKFGKKVKRPSQRFGDDYGDQMRIYDDAIEVKYGKPAGSATLIWPRQKQLVPADLSPAAKRATLATFARSWDYMNSTADAAVFPATPSALCGWCPAANSCPVANVKSENARNNAKKMHGGEEGPVALGIPTIRQFGGATPGGVIETDAVPRMEKMAGDLPVITTAQESTMTTTIQFPTNKWAAMATMQLADTAATHLDIHGQKLSPTNIQNLTYAFAGIVRAVNDDVFGNGFDWSFDSASRIVHSLNASIRSRPAPFGQDLDAWTKWRTTIIGLTAAKLRVGLPLVDVTEFGAPDFTALAAATVLPEPKTAVVEREPALV
ncbi:PD-(D/E)XK nuclease family protein [Microbacterium sp. 77mftsu3.1]|uniref:RecB family exonuclease n=1 Tax=Microbacterium sp. 77mftsu3.1 TaxID=1761802 RepID=UPI00036C1FD3|nr:PD-(D/E)XK nuclease family protein [Microbacterium sp. 77mftsu3.1]SDH35223.1 RecB family exonuclease [Microbacterium sp. 77mftsu3.1]